METFEVIISLGMAVITFLLGIVSRIASNEMKQLKDCVHNISTKLDKHITFHLHAGKDS